MIKVEEIDCANYKEIIDIMFSTGGFAIVYEEKTETGGFRIKKVEK